MSGTSIEINESVINLIYVVESINDLISYNGSYSNLQVKDTLRGGVFTYSATGTVDNGITFDATGKGSGYWVRVHEMTKINPRWFEDANTEVGIQKALDYIESQGGGTCVLRPVQYTISNSINARDKASLIGIGGSCVLRLANGINKSVLNVYAQSGVRRISDCTFSGFKIDGNNTNQTTTDNKLGAGLAMYCDIINPSLPASPVGTGEFFNVTIKDVESSFCKVSGFYFGKNTFVGRGYLFYNLYAHDNVNGVFLDDFCEYIKLEGCKLIANTNGIQDNGSSNIGIHDCIINNNGTYGVWFKTTGRNTSKKIVSNCTVNHNAFGVRVDTGVGTVGVAIDQVQVLGCQILANTKHGIILSAGNDMIISNNVFSGNSATNPNTWDDINIASACKRVSIQGNIFNNATGETKRAVFYANPAPTTNLNDKTYHKIINNSYQNWTVSPLEYTRSGTINTLNCNYNVVDGYFEYWNTAGLPPSRTAGNALGNVNIDMIPFGTKCVNNATADGSEIWTPIITPSSNGTQTIQFKRLSIL